MKEQVLLHYGYQRSHDTYETYHAFELTDPSEKVDEDKMALRLANLLDTTPEDDDFDYKSMFVSLPDKTVKKEYPELSRYKVDGFEGGLKYYDEPRDNETSPTTYLGEYEIIFEVNATRYYFFCCAKSMDAALARFFKDNPNISYNMIVDHVEV